MNPRLLPLLCIVLLIAGTPLSVLTAGTTPSSLKVTTTGTANFTIIVLPDTQRYSALYPRLYRNQTGWIATHAESLHIVDVIHEGDIVNRHWSLLQWLRASLAMVTLEDPTRTHRADGIPYSVLPGNHDQPTTNYNRFFGIRRFEDKSYYGGHEASTNDNNFVLFNTSTLRFIVISLAYAPDAGTLAWADSLLTTYADRRAIIVSHDLLNLSGSWDPAGQRTYDALKHHGNLFLMLCGHNYGEARRIDTFNNSTVYTLLANFQDYPYGGYGYLRILEFCPGANQIHVRTFSPYLQADLTDEASAFSLSYFMS